MEAATIEILTLVGFTSFGLLASIFFAYKYHIVNQKYNENYIRFELKSLEFDKIEQLMLKYQAENLSLRDTTSKASTGYENIKQLQKECEVERRRLSTELERREQQFYNAQTHIEVLSQQLQVAKQQNADYVKQREQALKDAKEAMFMAGREVFNKEAESLTKKTFEQFGKVIEEVNKLSANVSTTSKDVNMVMKSISSPLAAGQFAEIGLTNILKEYGLVEGQDFFVQYNISQEDANKRPDLVLFVQNNLFVIDSKASKFFFEVAANQDETKKEQLHELLKKSMQLHLNSLASKNYREAIINDIKKNQPDQEIQHVQVVMFMHSESHIEQIAAIDPMFVRKAVAKDIVISGPTGLHGLLTFARYSIENAKRQSNYEQVLDEVKNLLISLTVALGHVAKVGSGLKSAAKNFEHFVSSVNRNLLPKVEKINKLGVVLPGNKALPARLESFEIVSHNQNLIEANAITQNEEELQIEMVEYANTEL